MKCVPVFRVFRRRMSSSLSPPPPLSSLRGTVQSHNAYILLHTVEMETTTAAAPSISTSESTTPQDSAAHNQVDPPDEDGENYSATVFSKNGRLEIPHVTLSNVEQVEETIRQFAIEDSSSSESVADSGIGNGPDEVHILICTHMARDCRGGVRGGAFARTVHEQIVQRGLFLEMERRRYAPNVLIYPFEDWPQQVSTILDELSVTVESCGVRPLGKTERPLLTSVKDHWRGRMRMSKVEQASLAQGFGLGQKQQRREDVDVEAVEARD
ncbi:hypothetical protein M378DRAFT_167164 [Amanita muscaria Koide BX008]|uniref:Uncharacterized protein n=1 Tax=Amanita muscaria (strain Koide BX008) TaxID=946122 RepID=A0A0C2WXR0_AMAMK|nr:hypothetical protein M378DRAFT_167164 [Amanita muscaria Koide BX008]